MAELFLIALGIVLLLLLLQRLEKVERTLLFRTLKWTGVGVLGCAGIFLALTGRILHVAAILVLLVLLIRKDVKRHRQRLLNARKASPDQEVKKKKQDKS
jgi:predicted membrane protein